MIKSDPSSLIQLNERLRSEASGMQRLWTETARYCLTRKVSSIVTATGSSTTNDSNLTTSQLALLNTVAVDANMTLAAGLMSWIMPFGGRWFSWKPAPEQKDNERVADWLSACSEIALNELEFSNYYDRAHEVMLDRGTAGTASLYRVTGGPTTLHFETWDVGSYVIGEDCYGVVDKIFREFERTADQAESEFDILPPTVQSNLKSNKPNEKDRYIHAIFKRSDKDRAGKTGPLGMPIASVYIHKASKMVVRESGFERLPCNITRHLRWSSASAYGCSPAMVALAEIKGVQYLELLMSTLAEVQVNPRMILPQNFQGNPDLSAGGITMGGLTRDSYPQEWMTGGRIDYGEAFITRKEQAIKRAFYSNMFSLFSDRPGDMNIPHVDALQAEQLGKISPAFTSLTTSFTNPVLEDCFMTLYNAGRFPPPPREAFVNDALGRPMLLFPRVAQTNRMSKEIERAKAGSFAGILQTAAAMQQAGMPVLDNLDGDQSYRGMMTDAGLRDWLKTPEERDRLRQQRQMEQQAAQQREMLMQAAKSSEIVKQVAGAVGGGEQQVA
ncbi:MAG: bacteriophage head to tail connecting protein [Verrucomicrobiaceae bacterium]|nr:bacteriophage head to tail connecting protein [Verrucomicrobiaceae bacterium]